LASSNSNGKEALILKECSDDNVVDLCVRKALESIMKLTDGEDVATGLKRLQGMEQTRFQETGQTAVTARNIEEQVLSAALPFMLKVAKYFPDLIKKDDSSSISSSDMVEIDLDSELPDEESLFKYVMEETFGIVQKRGLERDDFVAKAREIFTDGATLQTTLNRVVPADYKPDGVNSSMLGTEDSDIENMLIVASNACSRWCKASGKRKDEESFFLALLKG
jgi:hypothetical protein